MKSRENLAELLLSLERKCQETRYSVDGMLVAFRQQWHKNRINARVALFVIYCLHPIVG